MSSSQNGKLYHDVVKLYEYETIQDEKNLMCVRNIISSHMRTCIWRHYPFYFPISVNGM